MGSALTVNSVIELYRRHCGNKEKWSAALRALTDVADYSPAKPRPGGGMTDESSPNLHKLGTKYSRLCAWVT